MERWEWIVAAILFMLGLVIVVMIVRGGPAIVIG
jgi:hypothetical protein